MDGVRHAPDLKIRFIYMQSTLYPAKPGALCKYKGRRVSESKLRRARGVRSEELSCSSYMKSSTVIAPYYSLSWLRFDGHCPLSEGRTDSSEHRPGKYIYSVHRAYGESLAGAMTMLPMLPSVAAHAACGMHACRLIQLQDVISMELQERGCSEDLFRQLDSTKVGQANVHHACILGGPHAFS